MAAWNSYWAKRFWLAYLNHDFSRYLRHRRLQMNIIDWLKTFAKIAKKRFSYAFAEKQFNWLFWKTGKTRETRVNAFQNASHINARETHYTLSKRRKLSWFTQSSPYLLQKIERKCQEYATRGYIINNMSLINPYIDLLVEYWISMSYIPLYSVSGWRTPDSVF